MVPELAAPPTVMVVDDSPDNLHLLDEMLRSIGYGVRAFPRATLALASAVRSPPDLILLDIDMPEMTGLEMCARLKAHTGLSDVPVIALSALTDTADKMRAFEAGGVDYITKPFQLDDLRVRVHAHLQLRQQRRALEEANRRLRELEAVRDSLIHLVVHDLRSPITVIASNLEWLSSQQPLDEASTEALSDGLRAAHDLSELVDSLLDVHKMEASRMELHRAPENLHALAVAVTREFAAVRGGRALAVVPPEGEVMASFDRGIVRRMLRNLVGNALKFTHPERGWVEVAVGVVDGQARVVVSDNGPGVPSEYRDRIFDKFFQVSARRVGIGNSPGLGLTFCKLAAEAHGGRVGVDTRPGGGSVFFFELPAM